MGKTSNATQSELGTNLQSCWYGGKVRMNQNQPSRRDLAPVLYSYSWCLGVAIIVTLFAACSSEKPDTKRTPSTQGLTIGDALEVTIKTKENGKQNAVTVYFRNCTASSIILDKRAVNPFRLCQFYHNELGWVSCIPPHPVAMEPSDIIQLKEGESHKIDLELEDLIPPEVDRKQLFYVRAVYNTVLLKALYPTEISSILQTNGYIVGVAYSKDYALPEMLPTR